MMKMQRDMRNLCAAALLLVSAGWAQSAPLQAGQPAPELNLPGAKGTVNLADYKGKVVYVDFWASWCGPCKQSFPWMNEMQAKYGPKGLQIVAVNVDAKREDADKFLAAVPASFPIAFDSKGDTPKRFQIEGMPSSVLLGADGKVLLAHKGFNEESRKELEQALDAAVARSK
jgi:cytochrome c biogenesis protein CcmG, thiol:disulfide interchange protein DsbE